MRTLLPLPELHDGLPDIVLQVPPRVLTIFAFAHLYAFQIWVELAIGVTAHPVCTHIYPAAYLLGAEQRVVTSDG